MGEFASGQRGQTVNLLLIASVVRIHLPPPIKRGHPWGVLFLLVSKADSNPIKSNRPVACWKNQFANWFSPYCFAVQSKPSNPPSPTKRKKSELLPCGDWVRIFCLYQGYCILILYPLALCDYRTGGFFCLKVLLEVCCRIQYNYGKNDFISEVKRMGKYLMSQKSR